MADVIAKKHLTQLERIKRNVKQAHDYFKHNYDRYTEFRRFVFETSLTSDDDTLLQTLSKPQIEFNIMEAYISRLLGEFSKQEPSIEVGTDNESSADPNMVKYVEAHLRHILLDSKNEHTKYEVYKDLLSGGFSVFKVTTEYAHPMSFNQVIEFKKAYDTTLCGFDPLARMSHKGDGRYCFENFPMSRSRFEEEYPDIDLRSVTFKKDFEGFSWSFVNDQEETIVVCDYYEKKTKKIKIVQLRDGQVVKKEEYDRMLAEWDGFEQPPAIIGKPRTTELEYIVRYRLIENQVIEYVETDYLFLPLVFVDGNSVMGKTHKNSNVRQYTRPYVYHAKGAQRLKNFAGISIANEIENIVQHKFIIKKEALPKEEEYLQAIKDIQKPSNIVVNAFYEKDPNQPIPEPIREIGKVPAPPEILQAFAGTDSLLQNILGSYDASLGINNNQLSGIAVVEAASQSNAAAMPYIVGFLQGLQRVAEIIIALIPKYYTTPRTIPIMDEEGQRHFVRINDERDPQSIDMFYDENALNVTVEAGVNFQVQKSRALNQIIAMTQANQQFGEFFNAKGLPVIMDNLEVRGIDQLKELAKEWTAEKEQQQQMMMQQMQQQSQMPSPEMMKLQLEEQRMRQEAMKAQAQFEIDMARLQHDEVRLRADLEENKEAHAVRMEEVAAKREATQADLQIKRHDQHHRHFTDIAKLHHEVHKPEKHEKEVKK